jgi:hypothetical protein
VVLTCIRRELSIYFRRFVIRAKFDPHLTFEIMSLKEKRGPTVLMSILGNNTRKTFCKRPDQS